MVFSQSVLFNFCQQMAAYSSVKYLAWPSRLHFAVVFDRKKAEHQMKMSGIQFDNLNMRLHFYVGGVDNLLVWEMSNKHLRCPKQIGAHVTFYLFKQESMPFPSQLT